MRDRVYELAEALDPDHERMQWPDPIVRNGRSLRKQAWELVDLAQSVLDVFSDECAEIARIRDAAQAVMEVL